MAKSKNKTPIYRTKDGVRVFIHPSDSLTEPKYKNMGVQVNRVKDGYGFLIDPSELTLEK